MSKHWVALASAFVVGTLGSLIAAFMYNRHKKKLFNMLTDYVLIGHVSGLNIFPVKSMKGVSVKEMECTQVGGRLNEMEDRHFMVVNENTGKFLTARQYPKLITVSTEVRVSLLTLLFRKLKQDGLDCGDEIGNFLCQYLDTTDKIRVLYYVKNLYSERDVVPEESWLLGSVPKIRDPVSHFIQQCPYLAICESTVNDLNSRLSSEDKVDMRSFRPGIEIRGPKPYDEDVWGELKITDVTFTCYRPCTRCVITTIDPDTGIRRQNNQPLKLLREYRKVPEKLHKIYGDSPAFGVYMGVTNKGTIRVGDPVFARYKNHPF
ncbi:unnamed protein product [Enterobius vermicularis]|uniref:MOSC domain-containing protein n=1 Tax=Enterobius vermicularis TaxID=51028 RepID=A0A0N4V859_ENTVE|nr:unnamed protein product [Enterobius vermicularis]